MAKLILKGERIYLQNLIERVSPETLQAYLDDIEQSRYMYTVSYPYTLEDAHAFYKYLKAIQESDSDYELGIFSRVDDTFLGVIALGGIDRRNENAEIGYWLRKDFWRKGYIREAAVLILDYAFNTLKLNRVYANLQKENTSSLSLLSSLGFQVEGLQRKHVMNKGIFVDRYICGLLREEWNRRV